ncbi:MAG TPA: GTP 3',8-cyclase MoaA [Phycisphaerales bacterium]|nr:GTP 3',8-cyclase MoaA [Phycisphaerales bacterium]
MSYALPLISSAGSATAPPPRAPAQAHRPDHLIDSHGRIIRDLRLSLTDRCNFRCVYCMDPDFRYMPKTQLLKLDEYVRVIRLACSLGIRKIRLTGGEPTLYPQLTQLIELLAPLDIPDLALTTNGSLLDRMPLERWRAAGLHRITLSLDSLRPDRVAAITRAAVPPDHVIRAIQLARSAGFAPIKVNAVIMRGVNDDELCEFADFAIEHQIQIRFIEFMPLDSSHAWSRDLVVSADEMLATLRTRHELIPVTDDDPSSTSLNFRFNDQSGSQNIGIGIIAPVSRPFCGACSRLRITADGKVRPCLFSMQEFDLPTLLRDPAATDADLRNFLVDSLWQKQAGHGIGSSTFAQPQRTMSAIGG